MIKKSQSDESHTISSYEPLQKSEEVKQNQLNFSEAVIPESLNQISHSNFLYIEIWILDEEGILSERKHIKTIVMSN